MNTTMTLLAAAPLALLGGSTLAVADAEPRPTTTQATEAQTSAHGGQRCNKAEERRNLKVMEQWIANLGVNPGANADLRTDDMTVTLPDSLPYGGTYPAAEYEQVLRTYWLPPSGPSEAPAPTLTASCDQVILQGDLNFTSAATGIEVDIPLVEVFTFEDGLVTNDTFYFFDTQVLLDALGEDAVES
jgi:hypothetical protein